MREVLKNVFSVKNSDHNNEINRIIGYNLRRFITTVENDPVIGIPDNTYDVNLAFDEGINPATNTNQLYRENNEELVELLVRKIFGYFNDEIEIGPEIVGDDDILRKYYHYDECVHISRVKGFNIFGMGKPKPLNEDHTTEERNMVRLEYLIMMNFLRVRHGIVNYVNIHVENPLENTTWNYGLGRQTIDSGNYALGQPYPHRYYHLEIEDMTSFTLRDAIYLLILFENDSKPILFHCAAGYGRTGSNILLLTLAKTLCGYLRNNQIQEALDFCRTYLFTNDFASLRTFLDNHYNNPDNKILEEIFGPTDRELNFFNNLLCHRMNTIKIAILYYITKMDLYNDNLNETFYLHVNDIITDTFFEFEYKFNLNETVAQLRIDLPEIIQLYFKIQNSHTIGLTLLPPLDGTNLPDDIIDIGPQLPPIADVPLPAAYAAAPANNNAPESVHAHVPVEWPDFPDSPPPIPVLPYISLSNLPPIHGSLPAVPAPAPAPSPELLRLPEFSDLPAAAVPAPAPGLSHFSFSNLQPIPGSLPAAAAAARMNNNNNNPNPNRNNRSTRKPTRKHGTSSSGNSRRRTRTRFSG